MKAITRTLVGASLALLGFMTNAQEPSPKQIALDIEPQPMVDALNGWAQQTGFQIISPDAESTNKLHTRGIKGKLTAQAALSKLLAGTPLTYEFINERTVAIHEQFAASVYARTLAAGTQLDERFVRVAAAQVEESGDDATEPATVDERGVENNGRQREFLAEVIVTAQKREERLQDVPISMSVLNGADLDGSTVQGATEALSRVPGVTVEMPIAGGSRIAIRGVSAPATGATPFAYYLDSSPFGFVKLSAGPTDPGAYDLQQIEVLRGPQGTLYGASTLSGVVRVLTHEPDLDRLEMKARTAASTTDGGGENFRGDAAVNVPIVDGKLAARAVVSYQDLSGWIDGPVGDDLNDGELQNYRLKLKAQPTEQLSIDLSAWLERSDYGAPPVSTDDQRISAILPEPAATDSNVYGLKLGYAGSTFSVTSMTSYLDYQQDVVIDLGIYGGIYADFFLGSPLIMNNGAKVLSEELILNSNPGGTWEWTLGAFYRDAEDRRFEWLPDLLPTPTNFNDRSESYAVFGEVGRRFLNDQWQLTLGLRRFHDDVSSEDGIQYHAEGSFSATTPRVVLTWYPRPDVTVYGTYAQGFRSGILQNEQANSVGFPHADPDRLHNYELGAKADVWGHRLSFDAALYYLDWEDTQQSHLIPLAENLQTFVYVNGESSSGLGVDFAAQLRPVDGLELGVNLGWNDLTWDADVFEGGTLKFAKGDRLDLSSEWTAGASADYAFPIGGSGFEGRISASANYVSAQIFGAKDAVLSPTMSRGDDLLFARAGLSVLAPAHWTATLYVDNATNEYGAPATVVAISPEFYSRVRPRTVGMQFEYRFGSEGR